MLEQYYNKETYTLTLPNDFNLLIKDLALGTNIIIFEENVEKAIF